MYTVISSKIILNYENYQDVIDKLYEYYINTIMFNNNLKLKDFLNSYIIIISRNNIIIREYKAIELYNKLNDKLNENNKNINLNINQDIIDQDNIKPKQKKPEFNHDFNSKKSLNYSLFEKDNKLSEKELDKNEYEKMFTETSIIPSMVDIKKSDDIINKLEEYLNVDVNNYDINKFNSFVKYIKDVLLMEPIHNNNINIINKTINVLCNLLTTKFHEQVKDKNIKDIILLMQEKIKQFNYQSTQLKKQSEAQQKNKRENLLNIYKSNLEVFNSIKTINPELKNDINEINNCDTIPEQFKIMYYAYLNSSNLDDFIKAFNEYYHIIGKRIDLFKEFIL